MKPARTTQTPAACTPPDASTGTGPGIAADEGSATPLIIGMVVCLLLLGAGVTAATSGFMARANLQHVCDGAASAAADAAQRTALTAPIAEYDTVATAAAADYVSARAANSNAVDVAAAVQNEAVQLACSGEATITFGALFGAPTISVTVHSSGRTVLPPGQ
ncbi:MAG: pilus assembly protein TadG-related protein [Nakamurella sp.]